MNRVERFKELCAYDTWASDLAMKSIASVAAARHSEPSFRRAVEVAAHIQVCRHVWLERLHGRPAGPGIVFFPHWPLRRTTAEAVELDGRWASYLERTADHDLDAEIVYTSSEGSRYSSRIEDILTHVINHGTYHRGQIARLVTDCGGLRAGTDFIGLTRRAL